MTANDAKAGNENHTGLTGRETKDSVVAFAGSELCGSTGGAGHRSTLTRAELDVVNEGTYRNFGEREAVTDLRSDSASRSDNLADLDAVRSDDVLLDSVFVLYESDACAAVRIILDGLDRCGALVLGTEEVDDAVHPLVTATDVTHCHLAGVVAAASALKRFQKGLVRLLGSDLSKCADDLVTLTGSYRFEFSYCHFLSLLLYVGIEINLIFTCKRDISLLEVIHTAGEKACLGVAALPLSVIVDCIDIGNGYAIELLHCVLDLKLVRLAVYHKAVTVQFFALSRQLLCYYWLNDYSHRSNYFFLSARMSCTPSTITTVLALTMA